MSKSVWWVSAGTAALLLVSGCERREGREQARTPGEASERAGERTEEAMRDVGERGEEAVRRAEAPAHAPSFTGKVVSSSGNALVLGAPGGESVRLRVNEQTQGFIDGQPSTPARIPAGADVLASYHEVKGERTALRVDVVEPEAVGGSGPLQKHESRDVVEEPPAPQETPRR